MSSEAAQALLHRCGVQPDKSGMPSGMRVWPQAHVRLARVVQFDREKAPERIVHARGMTAKGYFEVTHDISHLTSAAFLNGVGTKV